MGHNVGKAADNAVQRSAVKKASERTSDQILLDIRRNLDAKLAVTPDDVRFLLAEYDREHMAVLHLGESTAALLKRVEVAEDKLHREQAPCVGGSY